MWTGKGLGGAFVQLEVGAEGACSDELEATDGAGVATVIRVEELWSSERRMKPA